jgi:hypothetical protein
MFRIVHVREARLKIIVERFVERFVVPTFPLLAYVQRYASLGGNVATGCLLELLTHSPITSFIYNHRLGQYISFTYPSSILPLVACSGQVESLMAPLNVTFLELNTVSQHRAPRISEDIWNKYEQDLKRHYCNGGVNGGLSNVLRWLKEQNIPDFRPTYVPQFQASAFHSRDH